MESIEVLWEDDGYPEVIWEDDMSFPPTNQTNTVANQHDVVLTIFAASASVEATDESSLTQSPSKV
eukprot:2546133-Amphidinium_carterae.1